MDQLKYGQAPIVKDDKANDIKLSEYMDFTVVPNTCFSMLYVDKSIYIEEYTQLEVDFGGNDHSLVYKGSWQKFHFRLNVDGQPVQFEMMVFLTHIFSE